jgi:hypothetical protein
MTRSTTAEARPIRHAVILCHPESTSEPWLNEQGQWLSLRYVFDHYLTHAFGMLSDEHVHRANVTLGCCRAGQNGICTMSSSRRGGHARRPWRIASAMRRPAIARMPRRQPRLSGGRSGGHHAARSA